MRLILSAALAIATATSAYAGPVSFSSGWKEQRISLFSSNDYSFGNQLTMRSDGAVSIAWKALPQSEWGASGASWKWAVTQSVPATDLSRKGGDDRNLSLYFVFVPTDVAPSLAGAGIRSLLGRNDVRVIQYAWGGNHAKGTVIKSPYGKGGVTIPLRAAGTGSLSESVNLDRDFTRAFGGTKGALIGLAVSGDSDDTNSVIAATLGNLNLR